MVVEGVLVTGGDAGPAAAGSVDEGVAGGSEGVGPALGVEAIARGRLFVDFGSTRRRSPRQGGDVAMPRPPGLDRHPRNSRDSRRRSPRRPDQRHHR